MKVGSSSLAFVGKNKYWPSESIDSVPVISRYINLGVQHDDAVRNSESLLLDAFNGHFIPQRSTQNVALKAPDESLTPRVRTYCRKRESRKSCVALSSEHSLQWDDVVGDFESLLLDTLSKHLVSQLSSQNVKCKALGESLTPKVCTYYWKRKSRKSCVASSLEKSVQHDDAVRDSEFCLLDTLNEHFVSQHSAENVEPKAPDESSTPKLHTYYRKRKSRKSCVTLSSEKSVQHDDAVSDSKSLILETLNKQFVSEKSTQNVAPKAPDGSLGPKVHAYYRKRKSRKSCATLPFEKSVQHADAVKNSESPLSDTLNKHFVSQQCAQNVAPKAPDESLTLKALKARIYYRKRTLCGIIIRTIREDLNA